MKWKGRLRIEVQTMSGSWWGLSSQNRSQNQTAGRVWCSDRRTTDSSTPAPLDASASTAASGADVSLCLLSVWLAGVSGWLCVHHVLAAAACQGLEEGDIHLCVVLVVGRSIYFSYCRVCPSTNKGLRCSVVRKKMLFTFVTQIKVGLFDVLCHLFNWS